MSVITGTTNRAAAACVAARLREAGVGSPLAEAEWMLAALLGCSRTELYLDEGALAPEEASQLDAWVGRRASGEPLQYVLGATEFFGHRLCVAPGVFVPRPETEALVERAVAHVRGVVSRSGEACQVIEVGAGSGAIAISLAKGVPACLVVAIELSWEALQIAAANTVWHGVDDRVCLVQADATEALRGPVALLISNPPYVPSGELTPRGVLTTGDPRLSLDGGPDGMALHRRLLAHAPRLLAPGGVVCLECAEPQAAVLQAEAQAAPWVSRAEVIRDLAGRPRGVWVVRAALS